MEPKPKRRAMVPVDGEGNDLIDRLSDLPDHIAHHILSSLTVTDLIRLCCVSRRWGALSMSAPCLNIDGIPSGCKPTCYKRAQMMSSFERFLFRRRDNKVQSFRLYWEKHYSDEDENLCGCSSDEKYQIHSWINCAVRCNVETLDIKLFLYEPEEVPFPSIVFLCGTVRSLVVHMNFTLIRTPSIRFSSNLTKLHLRDVVIEDEGFFKWISCSCKFIQELHLYRVCGIKTISVESSSLKVFRFFDALNTSHLSISGEKLKYISLIWDMESPRQSSFNVCAPNLECLYWQGQPMNHISLGKFRCLVEAVIHLRPDAGEEDKVYEVLCSVCKVNRLMLNEATIKVAYKDEGMQVQLHEVVYLQMKISSFTDDLVPAVVRVLRGTPKLCSLYIQYKPTSLDPKYNASGFDMEKWKLQNMGFVSQVEDVTIELSAGFNGIEFARYILEHAKSLMKMVIRYLPEQSNDIRKLRESTVTSNAMVIFEENKRSIG